MAQNFDLKWMLLTTALAHYQCLDVDFEQRQQRKPASILSQLKSGIYFLQAQMKDYHDREIIVIRNEIVAILTHLYLISWMPYCAHGDICISVSIW